MTEAAHAGMTTAQDAELMLASRPLPHGLREIGLSVPEIHCGACVSRIERALRETEGVREARANLTTRRVRVVWADGAAPPPVLEALERIGFSAHATDEEAREKDPELARLVRALAVAAFTSSNVMLLSASVWVGADGGDRDVFHWLSGLIALPALFYSGRVFFESAWSALRHGRANMDVPISIGVLLAFAMSVYDTLTHGPHAYFDAATSLLFFLLIGRTLDHMMREKARNAVKGLARLASRGAFVRRSDGGQDYLPTEEIAPGMVVMLAAGDRAPVDGLVMEGRSDMDVSIVCGEGEPRAVAPGDAIQAGAMNLTGPLQVRATARAEDSFLAEMLRMMEAAEIGRSGYRRIADRAARLYAPVVHLAAFLAFLGWLAFNGDVHHALTIAVAVLIITCPCALGLAAPMVQVVAARRMFESGVLVKDGSALERLREIDAVVLDKTGTLTLGEMTLRDAHEIVPEALALAGALGALSRHPHAQALARAAISGGAPLTDVREEPGLGVEGRIGAAIYRLGRAEWALTHPGEMRGTVLSRDGAFMAQFRFDDAMRPGAAEAVAAFQARGLHVEIVSGDRPEAVEAVARALGVARFTGGAMPGDKTARLAALAAEGRRTLMIGDGLNDAPALMAAHVSMAPASAADVGRNAADFVFLRPSLMAAAQAYDASCEADRLIRQNFAISILYNVIALPAAVVGFITPLIAALAMSISSIVVVANALRMRGDVAPRGEGRKAKALRPAEVSS